MDEAEMRRYIVDEFEGVDVVIDSGTSFFFYNPDPDVEPDHQFPFVTIVTSDIYDKFSNLEREGVFRVNAGIRKETYRSLFGKPRLPANWDSPLEEAGSWDYDFTALDQVMPHPVYGRQYWVCVLNPSEGTLHERLRPLLAEAHGIAVSKYDRKAARR